jgi:hypothetical protein
MSTRPQPSVPERVAPEGEGPVVAPGPISASDMRTLYMGVDIHRTLGRMEHAIEVLEDTAKSHSKKLERVDRMDYSLPVLENAVALHADRIRALERVAHFAQFIGAIMIGGGVVYVARLLFLLFSK